MDVGVVRIVAVRAEVRAGAAEELLVADRDRVDPVEPAAAPERDLPRARLVPPCTVPRAAITWLNGASEMSSLTPIFEAADFQAWTSWLTVVSPEA